MLQTCLSRRVAPFVVARLPQKLCWRAANSPLILPYYHIVSDEPAPHVRHLYRFRGVAEFERDLDYLLAHYTPVSLADILRSLDGEGALPERPFHLTFDDGFREMHDVVMPILLAKGMPATFFLATGFLDNKDMAHHNQSSLVIDHVQRGASKAGTSAIEALLRDNNIPGSDWKTRLLAIDYPRRHLVKEAAELAGCELEPFLKTGRPYLSTAQVRVLLDHGFAIGAHSVDHPKYALVPLEEQIRQTRESARFMGGTFGVDVPSFAFPHTDAGVGPAFFEAVFNEGGLRISFGTAGLARHFFRRNLERFSMEKTGFPAKRILALQYAKKLYHAAFRRNLEIKGNGV